MFIGINYVGFINVGSDFIYDQNDLYQATLSNGLIFLSVTSNDHWKTIRIEYY